MSNVRSIALASAIKSHLGSGDTIEKVCEDQTYSATSILEINEAGDLTKYLQKFPGYVFAAYPEVDMHALPYKDQSFDLVIHSDTLEHIENPLHALMERSRVLKIGGSLCYPVPIVVGRMTRDRAGLKKSFHGNPVDTADDYLVHTEFGADAWMYLVDAGFTELSIHTFKYPAGIPFSAKRV